VVSLLNRKLWRDMLGARWQFLAIGLVAALGVEMFHASLMAYENQKISYRVSYERLHFADVTVALRRAPRSVLRQLADIPGVRALEGRIVKEVEVEQTSGRRPRVIGRLITLPRGREPRVNRVRILRGRSLSLPPAREVLLEASFAEANRYRPGDFLYIRYGGPHIRFRVAGIVGSPEYIYPVMSAQALFPMPETFGVMFVHEEQAESLLGMAGSINEVVVLTEPGRAEAVGKAIERRLRTYGPEKPQPQSEQPSNKLLQSDLQGFRPFIVVMPMLFLGTAALAVSLVLARWVQSQRAQIGYLRASGFPARAVLFHYLGAGVMVGVIGGVVGAIAGHFVGLWLGGIYEEFLHMPYFVRKAHPEIALMGFALSVGMALLGALGPARQAAQVPPAEAMRGAVPVRPSHSLRMPLPLRVAMPLRNMLRRPLRTLGTVTGVASAVILLVLSGSFMDSLDQVLALYFRDLLRYDLSVAFVPERSAAVVHFFHRWPGVMRAEPTLELAIRVSHRNMEKETGVIGVMPNARLRALSGSSGRPLIPLPGTILSTAALAKRLGAEEGDLVHIAYVQNTYERRASADMRLGPLVHQPVGLPVYMRLDELQWRFAARLSMLPDAASGALLKVDAPSIPAIRDRLQRTDGVALVQSQQELQRQVQDLTRYSRTIIWVMYLFGLAMAIAVIYTSTDIILWERTRELATLRTLGFGMGRLALLVTIENLLMAGLGAAVGLYPGYLFARTLMQMQATEGFSMQLAIYPRTYLLAIGGVLVGVLLTQWPGLRRIAQMDLAEAIRLREE
jgi:putative ABC transport system permease protein